jgi:hypothetical protein
MAVSRKIILGLGTTKSGTHSLAHLFSIQHDTYSGHETVGPLPWKPNYEHCYRAIAQELSAHIERTIVLTAWCWLSYIEDLEKTFRDRIYFICLKRKREDTIRSLMNSQNRTGKSAKSYVDNKLGDSFPTYLLPKRESVEQYYDDYYAEAERLQEKFPNCFMIVDVPKIFAHNKFQLVMFDFLKISNPVYKIGIHLNKTDWSANLLRQLAREY